MHSIVKERPEDLASNLHHLIADSEDLMSSIRKAGGNQYADAMKRIDRDIERAKSQLGDMQQNFAARTRAVRRQADHMVYSHPWETAGAAAAVGTALGIAVGMLVARALSR